MTGIDEKGHLVDGDPEWANELTLLIRLKGNGAQVWETVPVTSDALSSHRQSLFHQRPEWQQRAHQAQVRANRWLRTAWVSTALLAGAAVGVYVSHEQDEKSREQWAQHPEVIAAARVKAQEKAIKEAGREWLSQVQKDLGPIATTPLNSASAAIGDQVLRRLQEANTNIPERAQKAEAYFRQQIAIQRTDESSSLYSWVMGAFGMFSVAALSFRLRNEEKRNQQRAEENDAILVEAMAAIVTNAEKRGITLRPLPTAAPTPGGNA